MTVTTMSRWGGPCERCSCPGVCRSRETLSGSSEGQPGEDVRQIYSIACQRTVLHIRSSWTAGARL